MRKLSCQPRLARPLIPATLLTAAVVLVLGGGAASAATPSCGDTVTHDTKLTADLTNCPGDGLVIGADNVTLNLNGHTIDGTVTEPLVCGDTPRDVDGVRVGAFDGVTIENGTIQHFAVGINGGTDDDGMSNAYLHDLVVRANGQHGISIGGRAPGLSPNNEDNRIEHDKVYDNTGCGGRGIFLNRSSGNHVAYNRVHGNGEGIGICCSVHAAVEHNDVGASDFRGIEVVFGSGSVVQHNNVSGSGGDGIAVGEPGDHDNVVRNNHSYGNTGAGVILSPEATADVVDGNDLDHNGFGVLSDVGAHGNTISGNEISDISACPPDFCGFGVVIVGGDGNVVSANQIARVAADGIAVVALDPAGTTSNTLVRKNVVRVAAHDGYSVGSLGDGTVAGTTLTGNLAVHAGNDGFDIFVAGTTLTRNSAFANENLGFEAVAGTIDGGGNLAHGNGDHSQCVGVSCG